MLRVNMWEFQIGDQEAPKLGYQVVRVIQPHLQHPHNTYSHSFIRLQHGYVCLEISWIYNAYFSALGIPKVRKSIQNSWYNTLNACGLPVFPLHLVCPCYALRHVVLIGLYSERYPLTSQLIQENKIPEFGMCEQYGTLYMSSYSFPQTICILISMGSSITVCTAYFEL